MTTLPIRRNNHTITILCAIGIIFATALFVLPALNEHALINHGSYAVETWNQVCKQGPEATFQRDNRLIHCVKLDDGHYGAVVVESGCDGAISCLITAFRSRYQTIEDMAHYMLRTGATLVK
jgi:uncharacterized membrane protein YqiK